MSNELKNILNFFNVKHPWDITWAHALNSKSSLTGYLTNSRVQMIEGDIFWTGKENIMAHPPKTDSDLSFQDWYRGIMNSGKGAKLDFKMCESVEPCLEFAANNHDGNTPVFLNADVVKEMIEICSRWPRHATICLCSNYIPVDAELAAFLLESFPREKTFYDFKAADGSPFRI